MCGDGCQLDLLWGSFHYIYMYIFHIIIKSLCCTLEINVLYVNYISIFKNGPP